MKQIDFYRHEVADQELASVAQTFDSLFLTLGPRVGEFESQFSDYMGVEHAVGVSSCSMGILLTLKAFDIGPGDHVITTPMTFASTSNAALHLGAELGFADIESDTGFLSIEAVEAALEPNTKAVILVHLHGHLVDMKAWRAFAGEHDLILIEDAAHSIEARRDGYKAGQLGDAAIFSFYATKTLTSGDGGAVVTKHDEVAKRLRRLRNHGITKDAAARHGGLYTHWDMVELGYKAALTDIEAAILLPQLPRLEERRALRQERVERYEELLSDVDEVELVTRHGTSSHHLFTVRVPHGRRDEVLVGLGERKVGCAVNYRAVHTLAYYRDELGFERDDFPIAADWGDRTVTLPLWPSLPLADVDMVCERLVDVLKS